RRRGHVCRRIDGAPAAAHGTCPRGPRGMCRCVRVAPVPNEQGMTMSENYSERAWYLQCSADDVAQCSEFVRDRGGVLLAAELMADARILNEDRGLTTATGTWNGTPITVSAFGMGAAIAAVVLHELTALGLRSVVRLVTALAVGEAKLGDFVVADSA